MTVAVIRPAIDAILSALDPEQRAAAELPNGPAQIIAPAGSGKTTTLVARLGVLLARGVAPERICVVAFNRDAAQELSARVASRLGPHAAGATAIEVRTLHAMARQVLLDAGIGTRLLADRLPLLRAARRRAVAELPPSGADDPPSAPPDATALDTIVSAWKVEGRAPPPGAEASVRAFAALMAARGLIDFDDLVVNAVTALESDRGLGRRWQSRFSHVCVDEFQDVDAAQLRLVRFLAAPEDNLFVVGDDDQTIYAWRLADVRRILSFESLYPDARRVQLATNYRCPAPIVAASVRLIEVNAERFSKRIEAAGSAAATPHALVGFAMTDPEWPESLVALAADEARRNRTICFLARTRAELGPMLLALTRAGLPHATNVPAPLQAECVRTLVARAKALPSHIAPFGALLSLRAAQGWRRGDPADALGDDDHASLDALLGWAVGYPTLRHFLEAEATALARLESLRRTDAPIELVTVHGAKGREWETVVVLGMEEERFPNRRALSDAEDPERALEEERRLAYVALTRATRRLVLAYDPARPSRFLSEMGVSPPRNATAAAANVIRT
jgi:ATP-dependent DNA helicase UvrD/PcrA